MQHRGPIVWLATPLLAMVKEMSVIPVPLINQIESQFSYPKSSTWMVAHWKISLYACALYLLLVFAGRWYMHSRPAYNLRRVLLMWNTGLATFSLLGFMNFWPVLSRSLSGGIIHSVCWTEVYTTNNPHFYLWAYLFAISKLIEFGDTFFIVMRKTPLSFLHCYHHMTVLLYAWYAYSIYFPHIKDAIAIWFAAMNYFVHCAMYSYYAVKAYGWKLPTWTSQCITMLQLAQFVVALCVNLLAFTLKKSGVNPECQLTDEIFSAGMVIYVSYLILFLNFFYQRYIRKH